MHYRKWNNNKKLTHEWFNESYAQDLEAEKQP